MRLPNWPALLDAYIERHRGTPFAYGQHDCALFAAGAVQAITGNRPPMPVWHNARQAMRALFAAGSLRDAVDAVLPALPGPAHAQRGDVMLVPMVHGPCLAVCAGHLWAAPGASGLAFGPVGDAVAAWGVR